MSRAVLLRPLGRTMVLLGVVWLGFVAVGALLPDLHPGVLGGLVGITGCWLVAVAVLLSLPPRVLELSADGYAVRLVRASEVRAAEWREVETVETVESGEGAVVVFRLADGRTSLLPLMVLGAQAMRAQREIHERLNSAHGYRRLEGS